MMKLTTAEGGRIATVKAVVEPVEPEVPEAVKL
jgi:hypothetical protein